jgi:hypothetical protein
MARGLILVGLGIALLGVVLLFFPRAFSWFGRLPGDIRTETVFFPVTSMLLVSGVLTLLLNLLTWLLAWWRSR